MQGGLVTVAPHRSLGQGPVPQGGPVGWSQLAGHREVFQCLGLLFAQIQQRLAS